MKKVLFALLGAIAMASIPLNVNATDGDCAIMINSGETKTINYNTNGCRVENHGVLNVVNGANISKMTQDAYAAIDNYGTLNISGGVIYADYGYAVFNKAGTVNVTGGFIHSILHQAIWAYGDTTTKITGGTLKGAIGGEEVIYTNGTLSICGGTFSSTNRSNIGKTAETASCPQPQPQPTPSKPVTPVTPQSTTTTTTAVVTKAVAKTSAADIMTAPVENTDKEAEDNDLFTTNDTKKETKNETKEEPKSKNSNENSDESTITIAILATIAVLGSASTAIVVSRKHN